MRRPNHIILDFEANKISTRSNYWAVNYLISSDNTLSCLENRDFHLKLTKYRTPVGGVDVLKNQQKYTVRSNHSHPSEFLKQWERDGVTRVFMPLPQEDKKHPECVLKYSRDRGRDYYSYLNLTKNRYSQQYIEHLLTRHQSNPASLAPTTNLNTWFSIVNVNLLRKERLYTKLKYSRSPAFDIVSGGAAALLAGFVGFLISEKFGYELVDSGDFYYLFMYLVFLAFSVRPLLVVSDFSKGFIHSLSLARVLRFYLSILHLLLSRFK